MKKITLFVCLLPFLTTAQTTYYVSSTGNDSNNGTSISTPFQTLTKVNSLFLMAGDQVLFKRGDTFYGHLVIAHGGSFRNQITYSTYGTGAKPIIKGFKKVDSWTNLGGNIWESTNPVSSLPDLKVVVENGVNTPMGRFPNADVTYPFLPNFYTFQSHTGTGSGATSITSSSLNGNDWTGADVVVRTNHWTLDKETITGQTGTRINYDGQSSGIADGYGFFIQNDIRTLDQQGEWYYNPSTKKLCIYSKSRPTNILVSTINTLFYNNGKRYISVKGINFTGANRIAIQGVSHTERSEVKNCKITYCGEDGINFDSQGFTSGVYDIEYDTLNNCGSSAIEISGGVRARIMNNQIVGCVISAIKANDYSNASILLNAHSDSSKIQYNNIDSSAYSGIQFRGSNDTIRNNVINHSALLRDDAGGIYTGFQNETGKQIISNLVLNTIGNSRGTKGAAVLAHGIYIDDFGNHLRVDSNTIVNIPNAAIFLHNAYYDTIRNNLVYNHSTANVFTKGAIYIKTEPSMASRHPTRSNIVTGNTLFATDARKCAIFSFNTVSTADSKLFGVIDSNYYGNPLGNDADIVDWYDKDASAYRYYDLPRFREFYGGDAHSVVSAKYNPSRDDLRFVFNPTNHSATISLPYKYVDARGRLYYRSITLAPFSGEVLIRSNPR